MKEFEKSHLRKDPFFLKFQKRIGIYPDQILRFNSLFIIIAILIFLFLLDMLESKKTLFVNLFG